MNFQLVSALIRSPWFLPQEVAESYYPALAMMLNGHPVNFDFQPFELKVYANGEVNTYPNQSAAFSNLSENSILNIPISGPLMNNDQMCGPVGMKTIGEIIQKADKDQNVKGILLSIDSPGGQAYGTSQLSNIIKNTSKPVVAHVDGMAASAAYWIASAADKVIAETRSRVGSVGTMSDMTDVRPALEKLGVKFHRVISDLSPEKNQTYLKALEGDYSQLKEKILNPLANDFQSSVRSFRPSLKDDQLKGADYFSDDVVGSMVDSMGTRQDALNAINDLLNEKTEFTPIATQKKHVNMNVEHLNRILNTDLQSDEDGNVFLNQEQIEALETFAGNHAETEPAGSDPEPEPVQQAPTTPDPEPEPQVNEAMMAEISQLREIIEQMQQQPGATTAKVTPKNDPGKTDGVQLATKPGADFWENVQNVKEAYDV